MRRGIVAVAAAGLVGLTGCVTETPVAGGARFAYEWWAPVGATAAGLVGLLAAVLLFLRRSVRSGFIAPAVGLVGLAVGPGLFLERAVVTDDRFELHSGLWFMPNRHTVRWDEVQAVEGVAEERTGRRGRKSTSFKLVFTKKGGGTEAVPVGDLMKRGPFQRVLVTAAGKGIPVRGVGPATD